MAVENRLAFWKGSVDLTFGLGFILNGPKPNGKPFDPLQEASLIVAAFIVRKKLDKEMQKFKEISHNLWSHRPYQRFMSAHSAFVKGTVRRQWKNDAAPRVRNMNMCVTLCDMFQYKLQKSMCKINTNDMRSVISVLDYVQSPNLTLSIHCYINFKISISHTVT